MTKCCSREVAVAEFHKCMGHQVDGPFLLDEVELRERLIAEEFDELIAELVGLQMDIMRHGEPRKETLERLLKEMADLQYVLSGLAVTFGLNLEVAFNRVHASNMSKLDDRGFPVRDEGGKILKGPNYEPPSMGGLV